MLFWLILPNCERKSQVYNRKLALPGTSGLGLDLFLGNIAHLVLRTWIYMQLMDWGLEEFMKPSVQYHSKRLRRNKGLICEHATIIWVHIYFRLLVTMSFEREIRVFNKSFKFFLISKEDLHCISGNNKWLYSQMRFLLN